MTDRRVALAAVAGAHGVKGEVRLKLFSDSVQAAAERGLKPLGAHRGGGDPLTAPAAVFDPAGFEKTR